jgi:ABC-type antimicrobial peptide transport system permease subunit
MAVFAAMFFGMAGLLVMNTVYLSLIERIHELGIITALGASRRKIIGLVMLETSLLVVSGAALGGAAGALLVGYLHRGFSLPFNLGDVYAEFGYPQVLYAGVSPGQVALVLAFTLATALLSALWPASMAAGIEPAEAMRFVG